MNANVKAGLLVALATIVADQASKLYILFVYDIATNGAVAVAPFFDIVYVWNKGISYGLFQAETPLAQAILLTIKLAAIVALTVWLRQAHNRITALGLGLIIGGAIGNGIDGLAYGAVFDFAQVYLQWGGRRFNWYVFNVADTAIVAGVFGLLYDLFRGVPAAKAP